MITRRAQRPVAVVSIIRARVWYVTTGGRTGEAYVMFASDADALLALKRDKEKMGSRWVEVAPSTKASTAVPW